MEDQKKDVVEALITEVGQLTGLIKVHKEDMRYITTCKCGYYVRSPYNRCGECLEHKCTLCYLEKMYVVYSQSKGHAGYVNKCCSLECLDLVCTTKGYYMHGNHPKFFSAYSNKSRVFVVPPNLSKKYKEATR